MDTYEIFISYFSIKSILPQEINKNMTPKKGVPSDMGGKVDSLMND